MLAFNIKVNQLNKEDMDTKEDLVKDSVYKLLRISKMYSKIESMPIKVNDSETISTSEAHIIEAIGQGRSINVTQIADRFGVSKSAASQSVAKLEKRAFIVRRVANHGGREQVLSLTELGWMAFRAHEYFHGQDFNELVNGLNAFPLSQVAVLSVLIDSLEDIMDKRLLTYSNK